MHAYTSRAFWLTVSHHTLLWSRVRTTISAGQSGCMLQADVKLWLAMQADGTGSVPRQVHGRRRMHASMQVWEHMSCTVISFRSCPCPPRGPSVTQIGGGIAVRPWRESMDCPSYTEKKRLRDEVMLLSYVPFHVSEMAFSLSIPHPIVGDRKDLPGGKL